MQLTVYLSGEIHTNWREEIKESPKLKELDISFLQPVTDHALSDDCGVLIMARKIRNSGMITKAQSSMQYAQERL